MRSYAAASFDVVRLKGKPKRVRYMGDSWHQFSIEHIVDFEIKKKATKP